MPSITASDVIGKSMFAKTNIDLYDQTLTVKGSLPAGSYIGEVYSYLPDTKKGDLYWMFYRTDQDYRNFNPTYVKHNADQLDLPSYNDLLKAMSDKIETEKLQKLGTVNYYVGKYLPYIIGAGVLVIALPALTKNKQVSGMKNNEVIKIAAIGLLIYYLTKKPTLKGSVIVDPLDEGSYGTAALDNNVQTIIKTTSINDQGVQYGQTGTGKAINYVGPFLVTYAGSAMNGKPRRSNVI